MGKLKSLLSGCVPDGMEEELNEFLMRRIWRVCLIMLPFIMLFEVYNMYSMTFVRKGGLSVFSHKVYLIMYVFLFIVTGLVLLLLWHESRIKKKASPLFFNLTFLYALVLCYWGTAITLYDQRVSENVSVYVTLVLTVAVFLYPKPWQSVLMFISSHVILITFFSYFQPGVVNNTGNYINTTIIMLCALFISITQYKNICSDYISSRIIIRKNEEISRINEQLNYQVNMDELTQTFNRRFLDGTLLEQWAEYQKKHICVGALMLDIDSFKIYNDTYGHQAGDACIRKIADIIKDCTDHSRDYIMRYGGEEFLIIIPDTTREEVLQKARNICRETAALRLPNRQAMPYNYVTVSIGACFDKVEHGVSPEDFLHNADSALYQAKREGKNRAVFYQKAMELEIAAQT